MTNAEIKKPLKCVRCGGVNFEMIESTSVMVEKAGSVKVNYIDTYRCLTCGTVVSETKE